MVSWRTRSRMSKKKITTAVRCELLSIVAPFWKADPFELRVAEQEIFDVYCSDPQLYLDRLRQHVRSQGKEWVFGVDQRYAKEEEEEPTSEECAVVGGPKRKFIRCTGKKGCGSANTEWTGRQTRSADEGMTIFVVCKDCGRRWRFGG